MKVIVVTGGVACGKSTVCKLLESWGATCASADRIAHDLLSHNSDVIAQVAGLLGPDVVKNGCVDRKAVAALVFAKPEKLAQLEALLHPAIFSELKRQRDTCTAAIFVAEIPLYFEKGVRFPCDEVVAVIAPEAVALGRYAKTEDQKLDFVRRSSLQLPVDEKAKRASKVVLNTGDLSQLEENTRALWKELNQI